MNKFENKKAQIEISNNIFKITYKNNVVVELPDVKEISEFILSNISDDNIYGVINDVRLLKNMTRQARDFLAKRSSAKFNAIVLDSSVQNILAKMYFNFSKPVSKTKVFSDLDTAEKWIIEELKNT